MKPTRKSHDATTTSTIKSASTDVFAKDDQLHSVNYAPSHISQKHWNLQSNRTLATLCHNPFRFKGISQPVLYKTSTPGETIQ